MVWEDRRRDPQTVFFETGDRAAPLEPDPHAFLSAVAAPALSRGERRILVDGSLCPRFRDGMTTVFRTLVAWQRPNRRIPRIEATRGFAPVVPNAAAGSALLLSGGLDSLALLRKNRLDFPDDHPRSHTTAFFVHGFDMEEGGGQSAAFYERACRSLEVAATDAGVRLVPLRTNVKTLGSRWAEEHQGGAMSAIGHACARRVRRLDVAATYTWATLHPYGSHPALDLHYSSDALVVGHVDTGRGRLEKLRMLVGWPVGLDCLRVCWEGEPPAGYLNCGVCHKCVLTLLELIAVGALEDCSAFPVDGVTPALADRLRETSRSSLPFLVELLAPLEGRGRDDLAEVVRRKMDRIASHPAQRDRRTLWRRMWRRRRA